MERTRARYVRGVKICADIQRYFPLLHDIVYSPLTRDLLFLNEYDILNLQDSVTPEGSAKYWPNTAKVTLTPRGYTVCTPKGRGTAISPWFYDGIGYFGTINLGVYDSKPGFSDQLITGQANPYQIVPATEKNAINSMWFVSPKYTIRW